MINILIGAGVAVILAVALVRFIMKKVRNAQAVKRGEEPEVNCGCGCSGCSPVHSCHTGK